MIYDDLFINTKYQRILPRDAFNEAKLLKCMGQLCLLISDWMTPVPMTFKHDNDAFQIGLSVDGYLVITNLDILIKGKPFLFKCISNSKDQPYPLYVYHDYCEHQVFDDKGDWHGEFLDFCNILLPQIN